MLVKKRRPDWRGTFDRRWRNVCSAPARAMSAAAAANVAGAVTDEDVRMYLTQSVNEYKEACSKGFNEHKYEPVQVGLKIGGHIMKQIVNRCVESTQPGQITTMNHADLFTMVSVLAKTPW